MVTRSVNVRELIRKSRREFRIEDRLAQFPYLISPELEKPLRQQRISKSSRLDLLFQTAKDTVIVEIKRGKITVSAVQQILRYQRELKLPDKKFRGYLIGRGISADAEKSIDTIKHNLIYLGIGEQIPDQIVICWKCRRARAAYLSECPYDGETRMI